MDTTYMDTVTAQIDGNALIDYRDANELIAIVKAGGEGWVRSLAKTSTYRFCYNAKLEDLTKRIAQSMTPSQRIAGQRNANRTARTSGWESKMFKTTYTRGGHKYIKGERIY